MNICRLHLQFDSKLQRNLPTGLRVAPGPSGALHFSCLRDQMRDRALGAETSDQGLGLFLGLKQCGSSALLASCLRPHTSHARSREHANGAIKRARLKVGFENTPGATSPHGAFPEGRARRRMGDMRLLPAPCPGCPLCVHPTESRREFPGRPAREAGVSELQNAGEHVTGAWALCPRGGWKEQGCACPVVLPAEAARRRGSAGPTGWVSGPGRKMPGLQLGASTHHSV